MPAIRCQVADVQSEPTDDHKDARRLRLTPLAPDSGSISLRLTDPALLHGVKLGDVVPVTLGAVEPQPAAPAAAEPAGEPGHP